ncbi:MAG: DUF4910 domain-containing protein [Gammaproteobacteria bacterium]
MGDSMYRDDMCALFKRLWPISRSITGKGVRQSLDIIGQVIPIEKLEFPSGSSCYDWTVPNEWNIECAYVKDSKGRVLIDFHDNNLHVVSYSVPVNKTVSRDELMKHLNTRPDLPDAIPYRTSYYTEDWGFCIEHNRLSEFVDDHYEVVIDSTLQKGSLTIGEGYIRGSSEEEIFLSCYMCHPSMANNELSGPVVMAAVCDELRKRPLRRFSYRYIFCPETIGSIVYLSKYHERMRQRVRAGIAIQMLGIDHNLIFRKTRQGNTIADRAVLNVLSRRQPDATLMDWSPMGGGDQRQYTSLGINLPVVLLCRALNGSYPEYHTSKDNLDIISMDRTEEAVSIILEIIDTIEGNAVFENLMPYCEPQLGKRGLYPNTGGTLASDITRHYIHLLGWSDGKADLIDISNKSGYSVVSLRKAADTLCEHDLLGLVERDVD